MKANDPHQRQGNQSVAQQMAGTKGIGLHAPVQRKCDICEDEANQQTSGPAIQEKEAEEGPPSQMKVDTSAPVQRDAEPNKTGMPDGVKQKMESSLGADFSSVRVETESASATNVGALAYTQGESVHFAPGQFKPDTSSGQQLIGHELTHVVQQREGRVKANTEVNGMAVNDNPSLEREAESKGRAAAM